MEIHQRPGVYSDYTLSAAWSGTGSNRTVGIVGLYGSEKVTVVRTIDEAEEKFAGTDNLLSTVLMLLRSGAGSVTFCAAGGLDAEKYAAATEKLLLTEEVGLLVLDSESEEVQLAVKAVVENCSENGRECLAVFGTSEGDVEELTTMAAKFNSPRVVLVAGFPYLTRKPALGGGQFGAAAVAGLLAAETDPALPIHGAALQELCAVGYVYTEEELDSLILGGVTVLEAAGGVVSVIRGVTTCTQIGGTADNRYLDLTTIRIIDDVVPGIRKALKSRFVRKKNNTTTRGAIGDQVAVELENRKKSEIIDSYENILVEVSSEDPTVCVVSFGFAVTHGLGRILLTAHITV